MDALSEVPVRYKVKGATGFKDVCAFFEIKKAWLSASAERFFSSGAYSGLVYRIPFGLMSVTSPRMIAHEMKPYNVRPALDVMVDMLVLAGALEYQILRALRGQDRELVLFAMDQMNLAHCTWIYELSGSEKSNQGILFEAEKHNASLATLLQITDFEKTAVESQIMDNVQLLMADLTAWVAATEFYLYKLRSIRVNHRRQFSEKKRAEQKKLLGKEVAEEAGSTRDFLLSLTGTEHHLETIKKCPGVFTTIGAFRLVHFWKKSTKGGDRDHEAACDRAIAHNKLAVEKISNEQMIISPYEMRHPKSTAPESSVDPEKSSHTDQETPDLVQLAHVRRLGRQDEVQEDPPPLEPMAEPSSADDGDESPSSSAELSSSHTDLSESQKSTSEASQSDS